MKKKISFVLWVTVFFGGIWQLLCDIFSWKNKTPFWRVVWSIITVCSVALTCMFGYAFYDEFIADEDDYYNTTYLSDYYVFVDRGRNEGKSFIAEAETSNKILTGLDWIAMSVDGDSLVVFARDGKRGYFNLSSGKVDIPAKYDAAWCFNDGVAGVCIADSVFFIDHKGKPISDLKLPRTPNRGYAFNGDFIAIAQNNQFGLLNRTGEQTVAAIYDELKPMANKMWRTKKNGKYGVIDASGKELLPAEFRQVYIKDNGGILVTHTDYTQTHLDYDGSIINNFVVDGIGRLDYLTEQRDDNGNRIRKFCDTYYYDVEGRLGLMDIDGHILTLPMFSSIEAYSPDMFECKLADLNTCILLNKKGQKIND